MPGNYYVSGQWNQICDVCGFKFKSGQTRRRWDGLIVCENDFERDHPQKYLRVYETGQAVPIIREDVYDQQNNYVCYYFASFSYADLAEADCGRADIATVPYRTLLQLKNANLG